MALFAPAPAVAKIAAGLIKRHHPALGDAPVVYVFRTPAQRTKGRLVLGSARKVSGLNAFLAAMASGEPVDGDADHSFFVMEIAEEEWDEASRSERIALVDHELCHMGVDEDGRLFIRGHDLEEFIDVVRRHGLWREDVAEFASVCSAVPS